MLTFKLNLQLFAEAGNVVNTTQGYVNSYTGAKEDFTDAKTLAPEMKVFYDTNLLENARPDLVYAQFGKKLYLPAKHGRTMELRKFDTFDKAAQLQEGVIPTGQQYGVKAVTATINQFGTYTAISDILEMRAYDDNIYNATIEMSASASETIEYLIVQGLLAGTNVLYCDNITVATGEKVSTPTTPATMEQTATTMSVLTPAMINKAVTIMKKNKVPRINGKYVAVIHPSVAHDLRNCRDWIEVHKYAATTEIFNGEIGELHGCRFVESNNAPVLKRSGYTNKAGGATYPTYMIGADAFGTVDPEGGGLHMIIKQKGEIGGPLEQFSTIGYKFETNGATILYPLRLLRIMSCSSFSDVDVDHN